jgi:hypothetical protein
MFRRSLIVVLVLTISLAADDKPKGAPLVKLPPQTADVVDLKLPTPSQACTNYAVAIAIETMLRLQNVPLDQHFWVQKANGGELCIDPLPDLDRLARTINGTYTLDDGRKVTLDAQIIAGAPTIPDDAIAPLKQGTPLLILWKSRAYLLHGAVYDEYIYPNGQRMFQLKELKMIDPLARAKESEVSFVNGTDDPADIAAIIRVTATPITPQPWNRPTQWQKDTNWIPKKD